MEQPVIPDSQVVEEQLRRILASKVFAGCTRSARFLSYVMEKTLAEDTDAMKEYTIALEVFERGSSYDPVVDATVRVEAGRLRGRLRDYYAGEGKNDRLVIEVPKGGYRAAVFERETEQAVSDPEQTAAKMLPEATVQELAEGSKKFPWRLAVTAAVGVMVCGIGVWWLNHRDANQAGAPGTGHPIALAVMPFTNISSNRSDDALASGLTESLIRQFSSIAPLKVMARTTVERLKSTTDARAIGVDDELRGELSRDADGHLIVSTELSNLKDGSVLESKQYLPDREDLQPVQADIFKDTAQGLKLYLDSRLAADASKPLTTDAGAFQAFLRGEAAAQGTSEREMQAAILDYEDAVRRDPKFGLAWAELSHTHLLLGLFYEPPRDHMPVAREDAKRALAIDGSLSQVHGVLGVIELMYDWNYAAAASEMESAKAKESAISSLGCTSHLLEQMGRSRNAEESVNRMLTFDPKSALLIGELGCINYYRGSYEDAIRDYRQALELDPHSPIMYWGLGKSLGQLGRYKEAQDVMDRFKAENGFEPPMITAERGYLMGMAGNRQGAEACLRQLKADGQNRYIDPYLLALIYMALKDDDATYAWLDKAFEMHSPFLISMSSEPKWKESRRDPRFQALLSRMEREKIPA